MKSKAFISSILALSCLASTLTVYAADESISIGNSSDVPVKMTAEAATFSVTVPTGLPVWLSEIGEVTTLDDASITNNSSGPVSITNIAMVEQNGWTLTDYSHDFIKDKVGNNNLGLRYFLQRQM